MEAREKKEDFGEEPICGRRSNEAYQKTANYLCDGKILCIDFARKFDVKAADETRSAVAYLRQTLHLYVHGSMNVFSHETNVNQHKRFVVYNIKELGKNMQTLGMMIVLENLWDRVAKNRMRGIGTRIYVDEMYLLFKSEQSANFFYELYKRARKWGGIPTGITQNVDDLLRSETARTMKNSPNTPRASPNWCASPAKCRTCGIGCCGSGTTRKCSRCSPG